MLMRRMRFRRLFRARLAQLVVVAVAATAAVLALGVGSAFASGSYTCTGVAAIDTPGLQAAINTGGTVTVFGPKPCVGNWTVGVPVTIQGGTPGATLNGNATGSVLTTAAAVTWTVRNLIITNGAAPLNGGGIDQVCCGSVLTLSHVTVTGNTAPFGIGGGVYNDDGTVNAINTTISNNTALFGGGISTDDFGVTTLTASSVTGNSAEDAGGVDAEFGAIVDVVNSTVSGNTVTGDPFESRAAGAGIIAGSFLFLSGATVSHNSADPAGIDGFGGGVGVYNGSGMSSTASSIMSNTASGGSGGGIDSDFASVLLTNTEVGWNTAEFDGGGINFGDPAAFSPPVVLRPTATASGWGSRAASASAHALAAVPPIPTLFTGLQLESAKVDHNTAIDDAGGGIHNFACELDSPVLIDNSTIATNRATGSGFPIVIKGGGGYAQDGTDCGFDTTASLVATNSQFGGNTANGSVGGGIFNVNFGEFTDTPGAALVTLAQTPVMRLPMYLNDNQARYGGGIFNYGDGANTTLQPGSHVIHNQAFVNGGGVFNDCEATLTVAPGAIIAFNTPNQVFTNPGPCLLDD